MAFSLIVERSFCRAAEASARDHVPVCTRVPFADGFIVIMLGFLFQWPTVVTLVMFPILVWMYVHLAHSENVLHLLISEMTLADMLR